MIWLQHKCILHPTHGIAKNKLILLLLTGLFGLLACTTSAPTFVQEPEYHQYYVSPEGNDTNPGTEELPFKTIGMAAKKAGAGDDVLIQPGVYYEDVRPLNSGTPDHYITYQAQGSGDVIIDAQDGKRPACIEIDNKSYLKFVGLTLRGANSYETWPRAGISMTDGTSHIILDNITAYDNFTGIMAYGREKPVSYLTVKNSKTFGPGNIGNVQYGIFFYEKVYDSSILDNHAAYNLTEHLSIGIEISTRYPGLQSNGPRRILVIGNEVDHNESQGVRTWNALGVLIQNNYLHDNGATGIQIEDGSGNIVVEDNLSENNSQKYEFEAGVWVDDSRNVLIRNNRLRSNKVGLIVTTSDRVIVHDNEIYLNNRGAEHLENAAGLIVEDSVSNISVTHNTFYKNGVSSAAHAAVNFGLFNPVCNNITFMNNIVAETANTLDLMQDSCDGFVSDFNNFYNTRALAVEWNQNQMDWATYRTTNGQDLHSLTTAPLFIDPHAFDFSLQPASPLIARGSVLTRTTSSGSGDTVPVIDAGFFSDGFGIGDGDLVVIGNNQAEIIAVDYVHHSIRVDRVIQWKMNDAVSFPFDGVAPNIGANDLP